MSGGWNLDVAEGRVPSARGWPSWAVPVWTEPDVEVPVGDKLSSCLGCFGLCTATSFHFRLARSWWWAVLLGAHWPALPSCSLLSRDNGAQSSVFYVLFHLVRSCCILPPGPLRAGVGSVKGRAEYAWWAQSAEGAGLSLRAVAGSKGCGRL